MRKEQMHRVVCLVVLCLLTARAEAFWPFNRGCNDGWGILGWRLKGGHEDCDEKTKDPEHEELQEPPRVEVDWGGIGGKAVDEARSTSASSDADSAAKDELETGDGLVKPGTSWQIDEASVSSQKPKKPDGDVKGMADVGQIGKFPRLDEHSERASPSGKIAERQMPVPGRTEAKTTRSFQSSARGIERPPSVKQFETSTESEMTHIPGAMMKARQIDTEDQETREQKVTSEAGKKSFDISKRDIAKAIQGEQPREIAEPTKPIKPEIVQPEIKTEPVIVQPEVEKKLETVQPEIKTEPEIVHLASSETTEVDQPKVPKKLEVTETGHIKIASPEDFIAYLENEGIDTAGVQTNVQTSAGKVAVMIKDGANMRLENLLFESMEDAAVNLKLVGGKLELRNVIVGGPSVMKTSRRSLNQLAQIRTGLEIEGAVASIEGSVFESATSTMIRVTDGSDLTCNNCTFNNNRGIDGGAVSVKDSNARFDACHMMNNNARNNGGAIHFEGSSCSDGPETTLTIQGTHFRANKAEASGASIFVSCVKEVHISQSTFSNDAANIGGCAFIGQINRLAIEDSAFLKNKAKKSGGCLYVEDAELVSVLRGGCSKNLG